MPRNILPAQYALDPEKVAYWYLRLNGFLQIENFIVHPGGKGGQRTDADLLGVRFPLRNEFLFDHDRPMKDDVQNLHLSSTLVDFVIAEVKSNQICTLNGPWTKSNRKNVNRVLAAIGCLIDSDIETAADEIYRCGAFYNDSIRVRLVAIGQTLNPEITKNFSHVVQLTWDSIFRFIWQRFNDYKNEKSDDQQWDEYGKRLRRMAVTDSAEQFAILAKDAMSKSFVGH